MKSYKLNTSDKLLPADNARKYRIKSLDTLKEELSSTKSKLDTEFSKKKFASYWSNFDPFKTERNVVASIGNTINVSNAWLKCYELLIHFDLLPKNIKEKQFLHFDNAAFPGSFVISTHHLVKTQYSWAAKYTWKASSLLEANTSNTAPLEDKYGLYSNYKSNWLMTDNNNGDVLNENNQLDFNKRIGGSVNLYTSDLGFDVSSDFNNQESLQLPANIGQIVSGLLTLSKGGSFITKQYTTFEPSTIAVMYAVAHFFEEFYICKPVTSRMANSETYLVGKNFKGGVYIKHPYIKALLDKIMKRTPIEVPIFDAKHYSKDYLDTIIKSAKELSDAQIEKINADIDRSNQCIRSGFHGNINQDPIIVEFRKQSNDLIIDWYNNNPVLPINDRDKLRMKNALGQ